MKIDQKELAQIIKDFPQKDKSQTKINCPSPKKLTALLRFELPDRQRGKVIGHLANCSTCTKEIKFINDLLKAEKGFDREAAQILTKKQPSFSKKGLSVRVPFPHLSWRQGVLAAVATFLILFSSVFLLINPKKTSIERSALLQLEQINPNDISLSLDQLIFQWEKIPESDWHAGPWS